MRTATVFAAGLFALPALAAPVPTPSSLPASLISDTDLLHQRSLPSLVSWVCDLPRMDKVCQRTQAVVQKLTTKWAAALPPKDDPNTVTTPLGRAIGAQVDQVTRYTLPYSKPPTGNLRFKPPVSVSAWSGVLNGTALPPACAQSSLMSTSSSLAEDCLYMNVHVPPGTAASAKLPVFVWLHGGSFVSGSSGDDALDGHILAEEGKMIVITVQYRLGVFGFLNAPSLGVAGNMGVLDIVEALSFIKKNIASFGGDSGRVTLAGQSSGASLIKTLLSVPTADSLFARAILQSAPLNYGDHTPSTSTAVGQLFLDSLSSPCNDLACLQSTNVQAILDAQDGTFKLAPSAVGPQVSASEPIRPVVDGTLVTQPFVSLVNNGGLNNKNRALIFTTLKNEAGPTIASISSDAVMPSYYFAPYVNALMDSTRAATVLSSGLYEVDASAADSAREQLELLGTDWIWRCPNQQAAVNATASGAATAGVWLAEFNLGIPYQTNTGLKFCQGKVCHQDDIEAVFSTGGDGLTSAQEALEKEVLARWSAFAATGNPNPASSSYLAWNRISAPGSGSVQLNMLKLDGESSSIVQEQRAPQCGRSGLWGNKALFDEQIYI